MTFSGSTLSARNIAGALLLSAAVTHISSAKDINLRTDLSFEDGASHAYRMIDGREALCLTGTALLKDMRLREGRISVDVANHQHRHFAHILFHAMDFNNAESAYLRMHKSGFPDAVQYTPYINGESHWQLLAGNQMRAAFGDAPWVNLSVEFTQERARISVGDGQNTMMVDHLRLQTPSAAGLGLETLFEGCFSNMQVSTEAPVFEAPVQPLTAAPGTIMEWQLSDVRPFADFPAAITSDTGLKGWSRAAADTDGVLYISRYRKKLNAGAFERNGTDIVYARTLIEADQAQHIAFDFDLSDKGAIYLNGTKLFSVNNSFRAKGPLFRGDFDSAQQSLSLPLQKGRNELVVAIAERANGWGLAGKLAGGSDGTSGVRLITAR